MARAFSMLLLLSSFVCTYAAPYYDSYANANANALYSNYMFVSDLPTGLKTQGFSSNVLVYASSSQTTEATNYENNIMITVNGTTKSFSDLAKMTDLDQTKKPLSENGVMNIQINNNNPNVANYENMGLLYFVVVGDNDHQNTVVDAPASGWTYKLEADKLNQQYITVLCPFGAVALSQFGGVNGLTVLSLFAGGMQEANDNSYDLIDLGKKYAKTNASLVVLEPLITLHKSLTIAHSSFNFRAQGRSVGNVDVKMDWDDVSIAMSPNYKLGGKTTSLNYTFAAANEDSQFNVYVTGDVDDKSTLTLQYSGKKGNGIEQVSNTKGLSSKYYNMYGNNLSIQYQTNNTQLQDNGVYAVIECKKDVFSNFSLSLVVLMSLVAMIFKN